MTRQRLRNIARHPFAYIEWWWWTRKALRENPVSTFSTFESTVEYLERYNKLVFVAPDGFPVEGFAGRRVTTFLRLLFLTRRIMRYKTWLKNGGCEIKFRGKR